MKRQDIFLIGCLMSALSFLYFESSSSDFQSFTTLSDPVLSKVAPFNALSKKAQSPSLKKTTVVEREVATVE